MDIKDLMPWNWPRPEGANQPENEQAFRALQADINRAFESFMQTFPAPRFRGNWGMTFDPVDPRIDVMETDGTIEVSVEVPGLDDADIEVAITDDALMIQGEKRPVWQERQGTYRVQERCFGTFRRAIPLTVPIDQDSVKASCRNGVLAITINKQTPSETNVKRIQVSKS